MDATDERVRRDAALERAQGAIDRILGVAPDEDHARFYLMIHPVDPEGALRT